MTAIETEPSLVPEETLVLDGRYEVGSRLGGGGASDVYRARDLRLGRPVAVKVFRNRAGAHSDRRCGDEARLLAALNHPGLVSLYDVGWYDDREYLVLQLVDGRTLGRRIAAGPLAPRDVVRTGAALADVLHHVHAKGIVHRDVKPSNVLCADDGTVFLADFGISHPAGAEETDCSGVVVGTAPYLAPEQVQGGPVGPPSDVYALGLVLLECLTGKREYPGGQVEAAMARLRREPVVPTHTPAPLGRLIRAMTALDPRQRPTALQCRKMLAVHDPQLAAEMDRPSFMMAPAPAVAPALAPADDSPALAVAVDERRSGGAELPTVEIPQIADVDDDVTRQLPLVLPEDVSAPEPAGEPDPATGAPAGAHAEPAPADGEPAGPVAADGMPDPVGDDPIAASDPRAPDQEAPEQAVSESLAPESAVPGSADGDDEVDADHTHQRRATGAHRRRRGAGLWSPRGRTAADEASARAS